MRLVYCKLQIRSMYPFCTNYKIPLWLLKNPTNQCDKKYSGCNSSFPVQCCVQVVFYQVDQEKLRISVNSYAADILTVSIHYNSDLL